MRNSADELIREQQPAPDFVLVNPQLDTTKTDTLSDSELFCRFGRG